MASIIHQAGAMEGSGAGPPRRFRVVQAEGNLARAAVARLVSAEFDGDEDSADAVMAGNVPHLIRGGDGPSRIWVSVHENGALGQVVLVAPGSGRTAGVSIAPSAERSKSARDERVAVLQAACDALRTSVYGDTVLVQGLLEPHESELIESYLDAGFVKLAELGYLRRDISSFARYDLPEWPSGVRVVRLSEMPWDTGQALLLRAMESTYQGTQDCPALCGMRSIDDVLASHMSVGTFDPSLWWLLSVGGVPQGCMMLSRAQSHEAVELVYLGLGPLARGKGLAASLLGLGLHELQALGEKRLACAVDLANRPALKLYKRCRFKEFTRRVALIMHVR